ncbi:hypothetical protein PV371_18710 [Streptomyces sp. TX20-6-3]|uniref:hypothetical protein n=1 Tax=Streptomyces sp. TX20-6-3 TaxID=3028705 RepID=UPI0029AED34F|nr:hypothetical protein [Streptomyces sp. TX20-6-3]MDX2561679.1 hypothetical protein [Streptomyces sp. TX20-6-3]
MIGDADPNDRTPLTCAITVIGGTCPLIEFTSSTSRREWARGYSAHDSVADIRDCPTSKGVVVRLERAPGAMPAPAP